MFIFKLTQKKKFRSYRLIFPKWVTNKKKITIMNQAEYVKKIFWPFVCPFFISCFASNKAEVLFHGLINL